MKISTLLLYFGLLSTTIFGQVAEIDNTTLNSFTKQDNIKSVLGNRARNVTSFDNRYEGVKGSPFVYDDWLEGKLTLADSVVVKNKIFFKFDVLKNEIWVKLREDQEHIIYNKDILKLDLFQKDGKKIKLRKFKLPENENRHHISIAVYEGNNVQLIKDVKKIFRKSNLEDKGLVIVGHAYDWFEEQSNFYFRKKSENATKVVLRKGDISEAARLSKSNIILVEKFCKENNLKGKLTEEEAIKLVEYFDTLNESIN